MKQKDMDEIREELEYLDERVVQPERSFHYGESRKLFRISRTLLSALEAAQRECDQANEAVKTLSKGKPLGPLVGSHTIVNQALEIQRLTKALEAVQEESRRLREALDGLYELVLHEVDYKIFENGVTDSTGWIDEGRVRACETIEAARLALARPEKEGGGGR